MNGGILSNDNGVGTFSGPISVTADSKFRMGDFWEGVNRNLDVSGSISGSGGLSLVSGNRAGPIAPTGQVLLMTGNNSGYTGLFTIGSGGAGSLGANYQVKFQASNATNAANAVVKNFAFNAGPNSSTVGLPVVVFDSTDANNSFEFVNPPTITDQSGNGGIFAYNGANYMGGLPFDLTPLADGKVFLGTTTGATFWGFFKPGSDHTVRVTGATTGVTLAIGQPNAITDVGGNATNLVVGAVGSNAFGNVKLVASNNFTGSTAVQSGTLVLGAGGSLPATTVVTFGTATTNAAFDLGGQNETIAGLQVSPNVPSNALGNQFVINNSTTSDATLTVDTTAGSTTFAGVIKDGATKKTNLTVTGTGGNPLVLANNDSYTGATTINGNALQIGAGTTTGSIVQNAVTDNGSLIFDRSDNTGFSGNITGTGNIVANNGIESAGAGSLQLTGTNNISGQLLVNNGTVQIDNNTTSVGAINGTSAGNLIVNSTLIEAPHGANPPTVSKLGSVTINGTGKLDIADNEMAIDYQPGNSPLSQIRGYIQNAYNSGAWNGNGLTSSKALAQVGTLPHTALAYAEASSLGVVGTGTFDGAPVDDSTVIVKYALAGDANLDGKVNALDFNALASNFGQNDGSNVWTTGDFNYDGVVGTSDFMLLSDDFNGALPTSASVPAPVLGSLVPEPASLGLLAIAATGVIARRRR
jgi:fibronectin-binding autotransporter adhesin